MAVTFLKPDKIITTENGLTIKQKIIPDSLLAPKDVASWIKKGQKMVLHGFLWDGQMSVKTVSSRGRRNADRGDQSPRQCVNGIAQGTDCRAP